MTNVVPFPQQPDPDESEEYDVAGTRQTQTLHALRLVRARGLTWAELASHLGIHHGAASGVLSSLHKAGVIVRLSERRSRSMVYVLPEFVEGRHTQRPRPRRDGFFEEAIPILAGLSCDEHETHEPWCPKCQRAEQASGLLRRYRREVQEPQNR